MTAEGSKPADATTTCSWCSATVPAGAVTCPSCGAALRDAADDDTILGVTQVDAGAISRASRIKPGRIATWLGAEQVDAGPDIGGHVEPPSKEVREEMLRLELAAIEAELEAQAAQARANQALPPEDADVPAPMASDDASDGSGASEASDTAGGTTPDAPEPDASPKDAPEANAG
jgi:hypothetical protein